MTWQQALGHRASQVSLNPIPKWCRFCILAGETGFRRGGACPHPLTQVNAGGGKPHPIGVKLRRQKHAMRWLDGTTPSLLPLTPMRLHSLPGSPTRLELLQVRHPLSDQSKLSEYSQTREYQTKRVRVRSHCA